jgi:hypothetical protein
MLPESFRLPCFGIFVGQTSFAEWRGAWASSGLYFSVSVNNKQRSLWCRQNALLESDGLRIWIDTRDTQTVHRATRFCHWILAMPTGNNPRNDAFATILKINRAKENSPTMNRARVVVSSKTSKTGYELAVFLPAALLNGWNPSEQPRIGLFLQVMDQEYGQQTLAVGGDLPFDEDPSLWCTADLTD